MPGGEFLVNRTGVGRDRDPTCAADPATPPRGVAGSLRELTRAHHRNPLLDSVTNAVLDCFRMRHEVIDNGGAACQSS